MIATLLLLGLQGGLSGGPSPRPFAVGERLEYNAKFGILSVGSAAIEVAAIDTVRGRAAYRFRYTLDASIPFFKIHSLLESWTAVDGFHALRFHQENKQNSTLYARAFDIFADSGFYRQVEPEVQPSAPTPAEPLDDASVLYFLRGEQLEVGKTYRFNRYFRSDRNPIVVTVLKRENMELPDGTKVPCLVLNPVVGERGMFAQRAAARLWMTDDARRIPVQIRSTYPFGTITLKLERVGQAGRS